jgi:hypothetical protein
VRIVKRLRYKMNDDKIIAADPIPSFLCECLVWNAPNEAFGHDTYRADVWAVLAHLSGAASKRYSRFSSRKPR